MTEADKLAELLAKATPGPWGTDSVDNGETGSERFNEFVIGGGAADKWLTIASTAYSDVIEILEEWDGDENGPSVHRWDEQGRANAELIVAAVNALPGLLAERATQAAEIERLRGEVERLAEAGDVMVDWHRQMSPTAKFKRPAHVDAALQVFRKHREDQRHG